MLFIFLFAAFWTGAQGSLIAPTVYLNISGVEHNFLIDINGIESFMVKTGTANRKYDHGYNSQIAPDFKDLNIPFTYQISDDINDEKVDVSGSYGTAVRTGNRGLDNDVNEVISFGLIDKVSGEPTTAFHGDLNRVGRLALDPGSQGFATNLTDSWLGKDRPTFAWFVDCNEGGNACWIGWQLHKCFSDHYVNNESVIVPVTDYVKQYWQTEFAGYSIGYNNIKRKFTAVFSTTTPDIHVPKNIFNHVVKKLNAKKEGDEYKFDCQNQRFAEDIFFNTGSTKLTLKARHYANLHQQECSLRLRPTTGDFWVLGLPFYESYATCFNPFHKTIQFNTIIQRSQNFLVNNFVQNNIKSFPLQSIKFVSN